MLVELARAIAAQYGPLPAFLELVGANRIHGRRQGGSSMFNFGATNGCIETALVSVGIPYQKIPPAVWKKALGCPADKDGALARASELMPASVTCWTPKRLERTKEDCKGIAEAALIANFGATRLSAPQLKAA